MRQVNPNKASGPDSIPNRILNECAEPTAPILQIILQQSLDTGDLPKDWRDANISNKGNNKITELRAILQRKSQNS